MVSRFDVYNNPRWAGEVMRYHTWPTRRQQSVGEHTWQVMIIWFRLFGPLSAEESSCVLWHDAGELVLGDLPFPTKRDNPQLKVICDVIEEQAVVGMMTIQPIQVSAQTLWRAKVCDLLEMYEFGLSELAQGNSLAVPIIDDIRESLLLMRQEADSDLAGQIELYMDRARARY